MAQFTSNLLAAAAHNDEIRLVPGNRARHDIFN